MKIYYRVKKFIDNYNYTKNSFFDKIREILWNCNDWEYPEDWAIKDLQRLADAKFETLKD